LFSFAQLPPSQWRSARTTNAIERLHEEFKRRIKTQTVLPSAETAAMLFWALLASGQINMRKVDGWQTLATRPSISQLTSLPDSITSCRWRLRHIEFQHKARRHHFGYPSLMHETGFASHERPASADTLPPERQS
jgi:hypothetical protein